MKRGIDLQSEPNGKTVAAMNVSASGIGEIIGGSQREERLQVLDRGIAERIGGNHGRTLAG